MNKQSRSDFEYRLCTIWDVPALLIWDMNLGQMTVTNNIEEVIADIAEQENIEPAGHFVYYYDSTGHWDGYDVKTAQFYYLADAESQELLANVQYITEPKQQRFHE